MSVVSDNTSNKTYNDLSILDKLWSTYSPKTDIRRIITLWTAQVGYPVLQVNRRIIHTNNTQIEMSVVDCFNVDHNESCESNWWIPVISKIILNTEITANLYTILKPDIKISCTKLDNANKFLIVVNSFGYRVNYDRESWKHISFYLKNVNSTTADISDVTKAQLLDDAFYFLVQNIEDNRKIYYVYVISDLDLYLELASNIFHARNSYIAWYPVFFALESMSKMFPFSESVLSKHIKEKLLEILNKFLDNMSFTHSSENSVNNQFYHEVLKWTCILGGSKCKEHVNELLEWHFKHSTNKLLHSWQKWIYCQGLMLETLSYKKSLLWLNIFNTYQFQEKEEEFFDFLPCSRQDGDLYSFFVFLDDNSLPIPESSLNAETKNTRNIVNAKKSVTVTLLFNFFALHSKNNSALNTILLGLERYIGRDVNILAIINCIITNIYSDDGLSMITNESFLKKLVDIHHMEPFVVNVIKKKVENRRNFLVKMNNAEVVFNYKYMS